jgi:hypothetical protein
MSFHNETTIPHTRPCCFAHTVFTHNSNYRYTHTHGSPPRTKGGHGSKGRCAHGDQSSDEKRQEDRMEFGHDDSVVFWCERKVPNRHTSPVAVLPSSNDLRHRRITPTPFVSTPGFDERLGPTSVYSRNLECCASRESCACINARMNSTWYMGTGLETVCVPVG